MNKSGFEFDMTKHKKKLEGGREGGREGGGERRNILQVSNGTPSRFLFFSYHKVASFSKVLKNELWLMDSRLLISLHIFLFKSAQK